MRSLLFLTIAFLPLTSVAQKLELGVNLGGGISKDYNSGGYGSLQVNLHTNKHFMIGGSIDLGNLSYRQNWSIDNGSAGGQTKTRLVFLNPTLKASAKFNIARSYIYGGINAGYLAGNVNAFEYSYFDNVGSKDQSLQNEFIQGWSIGVHLGFTNHIAGRWSFNVEGGARINTFPTGSLEEGTILSNSQIATRSFGESSYYYPVSAGVRYSL
jgi:hypothetical protein